MWPDTCSPWPTPRPEPDLSPPPLTSPVTSAPLRRHQTGAPPLDGPALVADGTANLIGALRKSMATTGYSDLKEFQRVEVVTTV